ncbi:major facilitator superfamily domain-containing protein 7-like [Plakobranchus ocellatus]|uniref:Major facilitator superfamily domain-containing protein 7-like n=1 Tax=Plakobranchus ocellatus TaxID=259542 RepID=A0AAV4DLJ1_9GAST|nr:major facilitator superfamily domain-containing protein 7-like [Plakobranchus ocellatus]
MMDPVEGRVPSVDDPWERAHSRTPEDREIVIENALDLHYSQGSRNSSNYTTYTRRWFILSAIVVVNFTNALIWIIFSPVTDLTSRYFKISFMQVNWLSLVYPVASIPSGLLASWMLDTFGLRASIICAALLNLVGSVLRNITVFDFVPDSNRFAVLILGQTIAACGQTFIMFTPAKIAALWFPDDQRTLATTIASMSNTLGVLAANVLSPVVVKEPSEIPILLYVCSGLSVLGAVMSIFGVSSSLPPTPPSPSAAAQSEPFFIGIKKLRGNHAFWMLTFSVGGGLALFTSFTTFLEQILCPQNYSNTFAGLCGALMIGFGAIGAVVAGLIADKTRKFAEVTKIGFCCSVLAGIAFTQLSRIRGQSIAIAISITFFGMFGFAIYPTSLELAVELTYPVAEATSTGLVFLSGQLQGIVLMLVSQYTAQPLSAYAENLPQACPKDNEFDPQDWTIPNLISNGLSVLYTVVIVLFLRTDYKRMWAEDRIKAAGTLQGDPSVKGHDI